MIKQRAVGARSPKFSVPRDCRVDSAAFNLEVVTRDGNAALVRWRILPEVVEVWHAGHRSGVFARAELRAWLADPDPRRLALVADEVALSIDRMVDEAGRVAISLPDVTVWTIDPHALHRLRQRI